MSEFVPCGAIVMIVLCICKGIKCTPLDTKWIPFIAGILGIVLGIAAYFMDVPAFVDLDLLSAMALGGVSGLAATGVHQAYKQVTTADAAGITEVDAESSSDDEDDESVDK